MSRRIVPQGALLIACVCLAIAIPAQARADAISSSGLEVVVELAGFRSDCVDRCIVGPMREGHRPEFENGDFRCAFAFERMSIRGVGEEALMNCDLVKANAGGTFERFLSGRDN
jgi:hypothetical protein